MMFLCIYLKIKCKNLQVLIQLGRKKLPLNQAAKIKSGPGKMIFFVQKYYYFICVQTVQCGLKMVAAKLFLQRPNFICQPGLDSWRGPGKSGGVTQFELELQITYMQRGHVPLQQLVRKYHQRFHSSYLDQGVLETIKFFFQFEPKQTETQSVSVVFRFDS